MIRPLCTDLYILGLRVGGNAKIIVLQFQGGTCGFAGLLREWPIFA
jgi:hypothetical protein